MRSYRDLELFSAAQMVAALAMFPTLRRPIAPLDVRRVPYHEPGRNDVLMDWDLPKGKRARRRAKRRAEPR